LAQWQTLCEIQCVSGNGSWPTKLLPRNAEADPEENKEVQQHSEAFW